MFFLFLNILILCFCCVVVLLSLIFDAFPSVLVCNLGLFFFLNRFMSFEQRYTTVAFIYKENVDTPSTEN